MSIFADSALHTLETQASGLRRKADAYPACSMCRAFWIRCPCRPNAFASGESFGFGAESISLGHGCTSTVRTVCFAISLGGSGATCNARRLPSARSSPKVGAASTALTGPGRESEPEARRDLCAKLARLSLVLPGTKLRPRLCQKL